MGSFFSRQRGGVAPVLLDVGEVGGGRGREKSMVMDVPLLRTVPSKLGEGGGGGLIIMMGVFFWCWQGKEGSYLESNHITHRHM